MKINTDTINKILIIQYQPFGDVLLNTGYFPALRKKFKTAKIDFLVREPYHVVLNENPYLDEVIVFKNGKGFSYVAERIKLIKDINSRKYDLIIDQIRNTGSAQITYFSGAKYRLGFDHQRWRFVYNIKAKRGKIRYHSSMKFDALKPLGIKEEKHNLYYKINEDSKEYISGWLHENKLSNVKLVCFSPGSPVKSKKWSLQSYAQLGDQISKELNCKIVLLWGPGEKKDVEEVNQLMLEEGIIAPPTSFNQAAVMLQKSSLLVCNDGGLNHLSVAAEVPSIAIFGKHKPTRWSPVIFDGHYHFYDEKADHKNDSTLGISVEDVFNKVKEILK